MERDALCLVHLPDAKGIAHARIVLARIMVARIVLEYTPAVTQRGGIGRYARELAAALAKLAVPEQQYILFSASPRRPLFPLPTGDRVTFRRIPVGERALQRLWQRLRVPLPAEMLSGPAEIWHALDFTLPPTRMRRIVTMHDLAFLTHPECATPELVAYLHRAVPRAARAADAVITVSEHTRQELLRHFPDLDPARVVTIPLGVGSGFAPGVDLARRRRLLATLPLAAPVVLAVGTLEPRKNYPALIRAFDLARHVPGGPRTLVIAGGRGWRFEPILQTIADLHLEAHVILADAVDDADLAALYSLADVVAQVSFTEGFGLPVLEAMRGGVPVVASTGGALPEVAGSAALLVSPDDPDAIARALHRAVADRDLRQDLIRRGRARAAQLTWEATARATANLYARVAGMRDPFPRVLDAVH